MRERGVLVCLAMSCNASSGKYLCGFDSWTASRIPSKAPGLPWNLWMISRIFSSEATGITDVLIQPPCTVKSSLMHSSVVVRGNDLFCFSFYSKTSFLFCEDVFSLYVNYFIFNVILIILLYILN